MSHPVPVDTRGTNPALPGIAIAGFAVVGLSFLMAGHYPPWLSFEHEWLAALGGLLIGAAVFRSRPAGCPVALPALALLAAALAAVALLQGVLGHIWFHSDAALAAGYLAAFGASIAAGRTLARDERSALTAPLAWTLVAAAAASAAIALVQWLQTHTGALIVGMPQGDRPFGNLAQPNHLATLLGLGVVFALGLYERRRISGFPAALLIAHFGWGIVMTGSRTGWLFVALCVGWWAWQRRRIGLRTPALAVAAAVVLFGVAVVAWDPINQAIFQTASERLDERLRPGTRLVHWATIWDAIRERPWFGYGWSQHAVAQQAAMLAHPATGEWLLRSHNLLLDLMVANGMPIGIAAFAVVVWWLARQIAACRSVEQWVMIAAVGTLLLHALLEYPLDYLYFLLPAGLMIGALDALRGPPGVELHVSRRQFAAVLAALAGLWAWTGAEYLELQSATRELRFALLGIGPGAVPPPELRLLDQPREFHRFIVTPVSEGIAADELEWMRKVSTRHPSWPAMFRYATAAALNGRIAEAQATLARSCKMHSESLCEKGRSSWEALQLRHPALRAVSYPSTVEAH